MIRAGAHTIWRSCLLEDDLSLLLLRHDVLLLLRCHDLLLWLLLLLHFLLIGARRSPLLVFVAAQLLRRILSNFLRLSHRCSVHLHLAVTRHLLLLLLHL